MNNDNNNKTSPLKNVVIFAILGIIFVMAVMEIIAVKKIEDGETKLRKNIEKLDKDSLGSSAFEYENYITKDDPSFGDPNASVHIVEFSDFQCQYCKLSYPVVKKIMKEYSHKIHFVYRDFPLPSHPYARKEAEAAECAQDQGKFWELHDSFFENQDSINDNMILILAEEIGLNMSEFLECYNTGRYSSEVEADFRAGNRAGVRGTPAFIINGNLISGYLSFEDMKEIINNELSQ